MKKTLISSVFIAFAICLVSAPVIMAEMPKTDPVALWNYITKVSPYTKWSYWPDHQGMQLSRAPHGTLHRVYVNDRALNSSGPPLQNGSIEVMENYQGESEFLHNITVMYKTHGYNPSGWRLVLGKIYLRRQGHKPWQTQKLYRLSRNPGKK